MSDYSQHSVLLPVLVKDVQSALRGKDWEMAVKACGALVLAAAAVAAVATERKADEVIGEILGD